MGSAARIAAVRARQIDFLDGAGTSYITSVDDIESLQASNPELQYHARKFRSETSVGLAVTMEPFIMESGAAFGAHARSGAAQRLTPRESGLTTMSPDNDLRQVSYTDATWNIPGGFDPELEALIDAAQATTDLEEYTRLSKEADMRLTELHWYLWSPRTVHYLVHQPWIVGFNGELSLGANDVGPVIYARLWIDEQLRDQYVN